MIRRGAIVMAVALAVSACRKETPRAAPVPAPAPTPASATPAFTVTSIAKRTLASRVEVSEAVLDRSGAPMTVWLYRPAATHRAKHPPVIVIAAAGSPMIWGMALAEEDRAEHLPWTEHGYLVVAYTIDGAVANRQDDAQVTSGIRGFVRAHAGLDNARAALDFAFAQAPELDPARVFAVGHSSASVVALRLGAEDPRIAATVAFAPPVDVERHVADMLPFVDEMVAGGRAVIHASSPVNFPTALRAKPVFLFYAEDDSMIPTADVPALFAAMQPAHPASKLVAVPAGDHYDSMIQEGIPAAAAWLAQQ